MAMLIKSRARKPLEQARPTMAWCPHGVGGVSDNKPCVMFQIGRHRLIMTFDEYQESQKSVIQLIEGAK